MRWLKSNWKSFIIPALVFFLLGISYAVQAGKLGWYLDDWIILEAYAQGGTERLASYAFIGTRPLVSPLWFLGFWVAKFNPALWQFWALFWRALSVIFIWLGWRKLMPGKPLIVGIAALLLTVYPIFDQQASALTFSFHWIAFTLWALSFYLMLLAAQSKKYWGILTLLGLLAMAIQIFATEFFIGLEILRPVALFWLLRDEEKPVRKTIKQIIPWLIILFGYLVWRLTIMPTPTRGDRNNPVILANLFSKPFSTILELVNMTIQSLLEGLGGVWYLTIDPATFTIGTNMDFISWIIVIILFSSSALLIWRFRRKIKAYSDFSDYFLLGFGFIFFLGGIAPGLAIGRFLSPSIPTTDRFAMAAMPGAALIVTAIVWYLVRSQNARILVLALLIALSTGYQFRLANNYRRSWQKQERLFWQLLWRVPSADSNTAFLGNGAMALGLGNWATASALNMMYGNYDNPGYVPYWYVDLYRSEIDNDAAPLDFSAAHLNFQWHKPQSVVFQYETDISPCVWVVDQNDVHNPDLDPFVKKALPHSDLSRISAERTLPKPAFLGRELEHDWWCYYFQKGELAAQRGDWETVIDLYRQAQLNDQRPYASSEYVPFIQAAAVLGEWDLAEDMTLHASYLTSSNDQICLAWQSAHIDRPIPANLQERLIENYRCTNLLEE